MTLEDKKDNVLKLRMDNITLNLLERARSYVDLDKSKFIRQSIREKAQVVLEAHEKTRFTEQDWRTFFDMLDNRPEPTDRMKKAAQKYKDITAPDEV